MGLGAASPLIFFFQVTIFRQEQVIFVQNHLIFGQATRMFGSKSFIIGSNFFFLSMGLLRVLHEYSSLWLIMWSWGNFFAWLQKCTSLPPPPPLPGWPGWRAGEIYSGKRAQPPPPPPTKLVPYAYGDNAPSLLCK